MTMKCLICQGVGCIFCNKTGYIKDNDPRMPSIIAYLDVAATVRRESEQKAADLAAAAAKSKDSALSKLTPDELAALGIVKVV